MKALWLCGFLMAIGVLIPIASIFFSWSSVNVDLWRHFLNTRLLEWLFNTLMLVMLVGLWVTILGVSLAWLFVHYEFTGRRWLEWSIVLPMTLPSYVLAFIFLGVWDFAGPVQTFLRDSGLTWLQVHDVRNIWTLALVMSFCLYPYSYLLAREGFASQTKDLIDAAKTLGAGRFRINVGLRLGMAKTAIFAGTSMAMMETLADFGAVAIFNIDTLTVAIYKAWFEFFDIGMACQLASMLVMIVFVVLFLRARKKRINQHKAKIDMPERKQLSGISNVMACLIPLSLLLAVFVLPVIQLMIWVWSYRAGTGWSDYFTLLNKSLILASVATFFILISALLLVIMERFTESSVSGKIIAVVRLGYALPGSVLAVGLIMSVGEFEQAMIPIKKVIGLSANPMLLGGFFVLCLAYLIRFANVSIGPLKSGYEGISDSVIEMARLSGVSKLKAFLVVQLPLLKTGVLTAAVLVFVDILKEMPATLLLRPFGWDTLAVRVFEMTSEGEYELAALPALTIVLVGFIPVVLTIMHSQTRLVKAK